MAHIFATRRCALAIASTLLLLAAACYTTHHWTLVPNTSLDSVTSITTLTGAEIKLATPGATIVRDTMFAAGTVGPLRIPTDSIAQLNSHGFSGGGSFVVIGAFAAVIAALLYLSVANATGGT